MQRCVGPCGRLLTVSDFPRRGLGRCWDCFRGDAPSHDGHDTPSSAPSSSSAPSPRRSGRVFGF